MRIRKKRLKELYNSLDFTTHEEFDPLDPVTQFIGYIDKIEIEPWDKMKPKHIEYKKKLDKFRKIFSKSKIVKKIIKEGGVGRYLRPNNDKNSFKYTYLAVTYVIEKIRYKLVNINNEHIFKEFKTTKHGFKKHAKKIVDTYDDMIYMRNKLAENYFRYVVSIANNFSRNSHSSMRFSDIIQEGHIGLLKVLDSYNPDSNIKFTSYCIYGIVSQIKTALTGKSWMIRLPNWVVIGGYMISQETKKIKKQFNVYPTDDLLAELVNMSKEKVAEIKEIMNNMTSVASLDAMHSYEKSSYDNTFDDFSDSELISENNKITDEQLYSINNNNDIIDTAISYDNLVNKLLTRLGINSNLRRKYILYRLGLYDGFRYNDEQIAKTLDVDIETIKDIKDNIKNDIRNIIKPN